MKRLDLKLGQIWRCLGYDGKGEDCQFYYTIWKITKLMVSDVKNPVRSVNLDKWWLTSWNNGEDEYEVFKDGTYELIFDPDIGGLCRDCSDSKIRFNTDASAASDGKCWSCLL